MELVQTLGWPDSSSASLGFFKSLSSVSRESDTFGIVDVWRRDDPCGRLEAESKDAEESLETRDREELLGECPGLCDVT